MIWLFFTVLVCGFGQLSLEDLDLQISEMETRVMLLAQRRAAKYGYDRLQIPVEADNKTTPTIDRVRRQFFWDGLDKIAEVKSGTSSFLLNIKQQLFLAQCYPTHMSIFDENGHSITTINSQISHYSYIKSPSQPLIGFLSTQNKIYLCNSDTNFTECLEIELKGTLKHESVVSVYISRIDNKYLISLASANGKIHVYDQEGAERSIMNTSFKKILKIVDHAPYPVIISPTGLSMLEPNRMIEVELGCPLFDTEILDATAQSAYSNTIYILFANQVMGFSFSSKKSDKQCKISTHVKLSHSSGNTLTWMNPILFMNSSFFNISDYASTKQPLIPLQLCEANTFQSVYRRNQFYLSHKCCNQSDCQSNLFRKGKANHSTNKFYKFGIFIVLLLVVTFKMFNRGSKDSAVRREDEDDLAGRQQARLKDIIDMFEKDRPLGKASKGKKK